MRFSCVSNTAVMSTGQERRCRVKALFLDYSLMSPGMPRGSHELEEDIIASETNAKQHIS